MINRIPLCMMSRRSQTTILIILAVVFVATLALYFMLRGGFNFSNVPKQFEPVYNYYLECINNEVILGSTLAGEQGGYIEVPSFSPGSSYMPFSSQLDFLGIPVPYWYYISGNGLKKEQIPTIENIEADLNRFVAERISGCDFSEFAKQGYRIELSPRNILVSTTIHDSYIATEVKQDIAMYFGNDSYQATNHQKNVDSNIGLLYTNARALYDHFKQTQFLEEYGVDILRLYAPVDGVEVSCSPLVWSKGAVWENLTSALEANTGFIKVKADYYTLKKKEHAYFVQDVGKDIRSEVHFVYLREWPMKMDVWPSENGLLKADPIGMQEGYGMLGFCYVPYHFVYDFSYPILMQQYYQDEVFQFPVVVSIQKNKPREALNGSSVMQPVSELCVQRNTPLRLHVYNQDLQPLAADISFSCLGSECNIGTSSVENGDSMLKSNFPQCVNGLVIARAQGYETGKYLVSTVTEQEISLVMNKEFSLNVSLTSGGRSVGNKEYAIITFANNKGEKVLNYPEQKSIQLSEGEYQVRVYVYSPTAISVEGELTQKCVSIPQSGIFGIFGQTEEKCFDFRLPSQTISMGISGGGKQTYFFTEEALMQSKNVVLDVSSFGTPQRISDLQLQFSLAENAEVSIDLS